MAHDTIVAEELVYQYGELVAVDGISFNVAEGEILGFLGLTQTQPRLLPGDNCTKLRGNMITRWWS